MNTTDKSFLRNKYKQIRTAIPPAARVDWDLLIIEALSVIPELRQAKVCFVYLSRRSEVSTHDLVKVLLEAGKVVLTPSPDIQALPHDGLFRIHLEESGGGHTNPALCTESRIDQVDAIIVPGIVWDRQGYRIGFGGGYFDRLLAMAPPGCIKIGLAYECQMVDAVPREDWDEPVDIIVTETGTVRVR